MFEIITGGIAMNFIGEVLDIFFDEEKSKVLDDSLTNVAAAIISEAEEVRDKGNSIVESANNKYRIAFDQTNAMVCIVNDRKNAVLVGNISVSIRLLSQIMNICYSNNANFDDLSDLKLYIDYLPQSNEERDNERNSWLSLIPVIGAFNDCLQADEALNRAKIYYKKAGQYAARLDQECSVLEAIALRAQQFLDNLEKKNNELTQQITKVSLLISSKGCNWDEYTLQEQDRVTNMIDMVQGLKDDIATSAIYEDRVLFENVTKQLYL